MLNRNPKPGDRHPLAILYYEVFNYYFKHRGVYNKFSGLVLSNRDYIRRKITG